MKKKLLALALFAAVFGLVAREGFRTARYVEHWDEWLHLRLVNMTLSSCTFLPDRWYHYPSMVYLLSLASTLPHIVKTYAASDISLVSPEATPEMFRTTHTLPCPLRPVSEERFYEGARKLFFTVSMLGGLWIFLALLGACGPWPALLASAFFMSSWELHYHARWVAPDAVQMQFVTLFLCFALARVCGTGREGGCTNGGGAFRQGPAACSVAGTDACLDAEGPNAGPRGASGFHSLLILAALAGVATAAKYHAGALLGAVLLLAFFLRGRTPGGMTWGRYVALAAAFAAAFLLFTPGALIQPFDFVDCVRREFLHYRLGHGPVWQSPQHDIPEYMIYFGRLLDYVFVALPSPNPAVSALFNLGAMAGAFALYGKNRAGLALLAGVVVFYLAYFPTNTAFIVRNFLLFLPPLCLLYGHGLAFALESRRWRAAAGMAAAALVCVNLWFVHAAAEQTLRANEDPAEHQAGMLARFAGENADAAIHASGAVMRLAGGVTPRPPLLAWDEPCRGGEEDYYLLFISEARESPAFARFTAYERGTYRWIGPSEVNLDYYPTWGGPDRILVLDAETARRFGLVPPG